MLKQTFETSASPHIIIEECLGDLVVRGSEQRQITLRLRDNDEDPELRQEGETFTLAARDDCYVTCPTNTTLTIRGVRGDLKITGVEGATAVEAVHGDVALRNVGPTEMGQIYGDLKARQLAGPLRLEEASDVNIVDVDGPLSIDRVASDLRVEGAQSGLEVNQVGSDVWLGPPFPPGTTYRLSAGSDLLVRIPPRASLRLALKAGGRIRSQIPELALEEQGGEAHGVLGDGAATLEAQVGGGIRLHPGGVEEGIGFEFTADLEGLGAQIEARIAEAMAEMEVRLEESLGQIDSEAIRRRAEHAAEQARQRAERAAERARLRAERAERRWQRVSGQRSRPSPSESVSDEERMRVLRLVEEGKITPQEASDLLAALEGR